MFRLSISLIAFAAAVACNVGHAEIPADPVRDGAAHRKILMFGASWCAPCIAELRNIAALASEVHPDHIVIAWADAGIRRYSMVMPSNVEIADGAEARRMTHQYASGNTGLPYSVMINAHGRKCAEWKAGLAPEAIRQMRASCTSNVR